MFEIALYMLYSVEQNQYSYHTFKPYSHADNMEGTPQMMLASDMVLLWDNEFKCHLEKYYILLRMTKTMG